MKQSWVSIKSGQQLNLNKINDKEPTCSFLLMTINWSHSATESVKVWIARLTKGKQGWGKTQKQYTQISFLLILLSEKFRSRTKKICFCFKHQMCHVTRQWCSIVSFHFLQRTGALKRTSKRHVTETLTIHDCFNQSMSTGLFVERFTSKSVTLLNDSCAAMHTELMRDSVKKNTKSHSIYLVVTALNQGLIGVFQMLSYGKILKDISEMSNKAGSSASVCVRSCTHHRNRHMGIMGKVAAQWHCGQFNSTHKIKANTSKPPL